GLVPYRMGATCTSGDFAALLRACNFEVEQVDFVVHCSRLIAVLAARVIDRTTGRSAKMRFLRLIARCERLDRWPTRAITGYYTAALARSRGCCGMIAFCYTDWGWCRQQRRHADKRS